ncbi:hypothetical protein MNBD_GAMMA03-886 [hydrothermal vent metagenome]|uniref:Uncharacterized protein n=1 Tax=hydrothermal vent metagenome TaxID=652676 RepID=A0A3B0WRF7_9ZZZZ
MEVMLHLVGCLMIAVAFFILIGLVLKVYSILLALLAFPTYLGLYSFEFFTSKKCQGKNNFLSLNIPNKNPFKTIMNVAASSVSVSLLLLATNVLDVINTSEFHTLEKQVIFLKFAFEEVISSPAPLITAFLGLIVIYVVSYYCAEKDEHGSWTKIENLSIPSLWKVLTKGVAKS